MQKKKILGIALIIIIFLTLFGTIVYVFNELKNENDIRLQNIDTTDAKKFKSEYEELNGKEVKDGINYRTVSISENNPIKYVTASDLITRMDNNETFVVYFGFNSCPWCRSIIEPLLKSASKNNIGTIYYVDIKNIRDTYELDDEHKAVRTVEGTDGYYQLLNRFNNVLDDYKDLEYTTTKTVKKKKKEVTVKVEINEKRIYAPNVVLVKNGKPIKLTTGISNKLENPYDELNDELINYSIDAFNDLFKDITTTTTGEVCTGQGNC